MLSRSQLEERGYSQSYIRARLKLDNLCCGVVSRSISRVKALELYGQIESEYLADEPGNAELFRGIYRSKIMRLCESFSGQRPGGS